MSELCDTLAAVELPVPKEFQPLMILASLPASYTAIVLTLGSQARKLDLSHMTSMIMDDDARRRGSSGHDDQALVSHGGQPRKNPAVGTLQLRLPRTAQTSQPISCTDTLGRKPTQVKPYVNFLPKTSI